MIALKKRKKKKANKFRKSKRPDSHIEPSTKTRASQTRDSSMKSKKHENDGLDSRKASISSLSIDRSETK